jgi:hypothetical protein
MNVCGQCPAVGGLVVRLITMLNLSLSAISQQRLSMSDLMGGGGGRRELGGKGGLVTWDKSLVM